ncbi:MAG: flagellar export chaperone FliS [Nitrospirae bacterium]|nr:flagellar export chaperone FliS [Nitrospirota bacterium]
MQQLTAYRSAEINTSDRVKIISLLYDGAINFIKMAMSRMEEKDIAGKGLYIGKATSIIAELSSSLNMEEGGEVSQNLRRLYDFVLDRLLIANLRNEMEALENAEKVLQHLRDGWKEMERKLSTASAGASKPALSLENGVRI